MNTGTVELSRQATAWLACFAFALTFLVASLAGASGLTALTRGVIVTAAVLVCGRTLVRPVVDTVLNAMARDQAKEPEPEDDA